MPSDFASDPLASDLGAPQLGGLLNLPLPPHTSRWKGTEVASIPGPPWGPGAQGPIWFHLPVLSLPLRHVSKGVSSPLSSVMWLERNPGPERAGGTHLTPDHWASLSPFDPLIYPACEAGKPEGKRTDPMALPVAYPLL